MFPNLHKKEREGLDCAQIPLGILSTVAPYSNCKGIYSNCLHHLELSVVPDVCTGSSFRPPCLQRVSTFLGWKELFRSPNPRQLLLLEPNAYTSSSWVTTSASLPVDPNTHAIFTSLRKLASSKLKMGHQDRLRVLPDMSMQVRVSALQTVCKLWRGGPAQITMLLLLLLPLKAIKNLIKLRAAQA